MLKTTNLYWFLNNASKRNNSLNGNSSKPQNKLIEAHHTTCQIQSPW